MFYYEIKRYGIDTSKDSPMVQAKESKIKLNGKMHTLKKIDYYDECGRELSSTIEISRHSHAAQEHFKFKLLHAIGANAFFSNPTPSSFKEFLAANQILGNPKEEHDSDFVYSDSFFDGKAKFCIKYPTYKAFPKYADYRVYSYGEIVNYPYLLENYIH